MVLRKKRKKKKGKKDKCLIECHYGTVKVFSVDYKGKKLMFYGGGDLRGYRYTSVDVTISLNEPIVSILSNIPIEHDDFGIYEIYIPVHDGGVPSLSKKDYLKILDIICDFFEDKDIIKIGVKCDGGHGRTGTVLAIYAALLLNVKKPISFVRDVYCRNAVETEKQVEYIAKITGHKEKVELSHKGIYDLFLAWR